MGEALNPTLIAKISQALRPDWTRTLLARRVTAGVLVALAGVAAFRPDPQGDRVDVVDARHDIAPGAALTAADVALESRSVQTVPDGAATDVPSLLNATLAGPARRGEVLTDVRVLDSRLTEAAAGPDARIVGLHPADAALVDVLRPGDIVDVVTAAPDDVAGVAGAPQLVATGGVVVLVSEKANHDDRVVLVALPATAAVAVAGATLTQPVTLTLR